MANLDDIIWRAYHRIRQYARHSTGRFFGTIASSDSRYKFMMDLLEKVYALRVENSTLTKILLDKKILTKDEFQAYLRDELSLYEDDLRKIWPEITPFKDGHGVQIDRDLFVKRLTDEKWPP